MNLLKTYFPPVVDSNGAVSWRLTVHSAIYFLLLVVLIGSQPVSNFMMSGMEILLAVNWALEWDMRAKWQRARRSPLLWAFLVLMVVHLVWMIPSQNAAYGWNDIFKKLPLLAIPLVVLTSRPLVRRQLTMMLFAFVGTVFVATIIGRIRLATIPDLPYRQIIPFISHIRFAMNVCLAIVVIVWFCVERTKRTGRLFSDWLLWVLLAVTVALVDFLFKLRSYTAFVMLFVVSVVLLAVFWRRIANRWLAFVLTTAVVLVAAVTMLVSVGMFLLWEHKWLRNVGTFAVLCSTVTLHAIFNIMVSEPGLSTWIGSAVPMVLIGCILMITVKKDIFKDVEIFSTGIYHIGLSFRVFVVISQTILWVG